MIKFKRKKLVVFGTVIGFVIVLLLGTTYLRLKHQEISLDKGNSIQQDSTEITGGGTPGKIISGSFDKTKLKSEADWKKILTPGQFNILREQGTEIPFTGKLEYENRKGTYYSVGCNEPIFRSEQKYDSGTGWPSFWAPINTDSVVLRQDDSIPGEPRVEVLDKCGGHLGHLFDDWPQPTGKRYCMNSEAMYFVPDKQ